MTTFVHPTGAPPASPRTGVSVAPEALVKDVAGLVSPPDVCLRIFELLQSPLTSARDIGEVIARDPNLTARLLRIVNSPFYGFTRRIDTVSRAIAVVGTRDLYSLVIAICAVRSFSNLSTQLVSMDTFWRHSVFAALIARKLARRCRILHPERLFVAGLLHDIGALVLYHRIPEVARDLLLLAAGDEDALHAAEGRELGFSHAELGALLLELWNLPPALGDAVRFHHRPGAAPGPAAREAGILHVAEVLANRSELGAFCEAPAAVAAPGPEAVAALGLDGATLDPEALIGEAGVEFTETAGILLRR